MFVHLKILAKQKKKKSNFGLRKMEDERKRSICINVLFSGISSFY